MKYIKLFDNYSVYENYKLGSEFIEIEGKDVVSLCKQQNELCYDKYIPHDYSTDYLTFIAIENGTFKFNGAKTSNIVSYSIDNGETWTSLNNTDSPVIKKGHKILWKASGLTNYTGIGTFSSTCKFNVEGNIMSLLYSDNFAGQTNLIEDNIFAKLFKNCTKLINARNLILPAISLTAYCYWNMFNNCINLKTVPLLPATTLNQFCYFWMFYNCTSLTTVQPNMLPATTLTVYCYQNMFYGCTSLIKAPELPASILPSGCYRNMFKNCTSLNYIKCLATDISTNSNTTSDWVYNVPTKGGTFIKAKDTVWSRGNNGIPSYYWTVIDV